MVRKRNVEHSWSTCGPPLDTFFHIVIKKDIQRLHSKSQTKQHVKDTTDEMKQLKRVQKQFDKLAEETAAQVPECIGSEDEDWGDRPKGSVNYYGLHKCVHPLFFHFIDIPLHSVTFHSIPSF